MYKRGDVVTEIDNPDNRFVIIKKGAEGKYYKTINITGEYVDDMASWDLELAKRAKPFKVVTFKSGVYTGVVAKKGKELYISLGCRFFTNIADAKNHWANDGTGYWSENSFGSADYEFPAKAWADRQKENTKRLNAVLKAVAKVKEL